MPPFEKVVEFLVQKSGRSQEDILELVSSKLKEFAGLVSKEGALHLVANDLQIPIDTQLVTDISQIQVGKDFTIQATVEKKYEPKSFTSAKREGKVGSLQLRDSTGTIRLVFWNEDCIHMQQFSQGSTYKIKQLNAKDNKGQIELLYSSRSKVEVIQAAPQTQMKINELAVAQEASIQGIIVAVNAPKFYTVDRKTKKKTLEPFDPAIHDKSWLMSISIDDETDVIRATAFRDVACQLVSCTQEQFGIFETAPFDAIQHKLLGATIKARGRVTQNPLQEKKELVLTSVELLD
jgi:ssDNA-binding replication factor A large subunit